MKRLLTIALVLLLALFTLTACGGGSGSGNSGGNAPASDISEADMEKAADLVKDVIDASDLENKDELKETLDMVLNTNWPADRIPGIVPPYPDGSCMADNEPGYITIMINETSTESRDKYIEMLTGEGWEITEDHETYDGPVLYKAVKEGVEIMFVSLQKDPINKIYMFVSWEV